MSILMDDIIWPILLIMYDYLFLFSLVAIDPTAPTAEDGGEIDLAFSWTGHQAERARPFVPWKPTSDVQALCKEFPDINLDSQWGARQVAFSSFER